MSYEKLAERLEELDRELNPPAAMDIVRRFDLSRLFPDGVPELPIPPDHGIVVGQALTVGEAKAKADAEEIVEDERIKKLSSHLKRTTKGQPVATDLSPTPSQIANLGGKDDD